MGWYTLGIPVSVVAIGAFFMKEPPRGQYEKEDVLGEVIEDENPAPISMEAAFARLKKIATIRTVLVAFCALGFGLFSQGSLAVAVPRTTPPRDQRLRARADPRACRASPRCRSCRSSAATSTGLPHEPARRRSRSSVR